jgi:hypothetical protein
LTGNKILNLKAGIEKFIAGLILSLILSGFAYSAEQDYFDVYALEVEGVIHNFLSGRFNDDELADIAIIYSPHADRNTRYLGLYLHKANGEFRPRADYLIELPNSTVQVDAGDVDDDRLDEIVIIDADGVSRIDFSPQTGLSQPRRIIKRETLFSIPLFQGILVIPFLYDFSSSPGLEVIVPVPRGIALYEKGDDGTYQILNFLDAAASSRKLARKMKNLSGFKNHDIQISLPDLMVMDGNLDGFRDLYFLWEDRLLCYFQDSTGNFSQIPDLELDLKGDNLVSYQQSRLVDCNGDRRPDLIVVNTAGGITSTESKLRIYLADMSGRISSRYNSEISLSDSHCNLLVDDFNGDNVMEIAVPAVEMGTFAATKIFLTKKTDLHLLIYTVNAGVPGNEPDKRLDYEFRFNFDDCNPTGEVSIDWSGKYNDDNLLDAVFSDGNGRILFYWGNDRDFLSKKADLEVTLDHASCVYPIHLDSDRFSDLIVEHNLTGRYDRLTVLKNKSGEL